MFCFLKCKCLWFVYLYVVVIATGLSVSALPRYVKQGCLGRISGESGSMRNAFCTTVWFVYTRLVHKPSGWDGSEWQIDCSLCASMVKILSMLSKIYRYSLLPPWEIDNSKISRGWYELDFAACQMNMSFDKASGSNSKKSSWNTFPKDSSFMLLWLFLTIYLSYVVFIYVMYLCFILFKAIRHENAP